MKKFLKYLAEARLAKEQEFEFFQFKHIVSALKDLTVDIHNVAIKSVNAVIDKFCSFVKIDCDKFKSENPNISKKIADLIIPPSDADFLPLAIVHYDTADVYMMVVHVSTGNFISKIIGSAFGTFSILYNKITKNVNRVYLFPIKPDFETGRISIDSSSTAIGQFAMTILLSDIDFKIIWPVSTGDGIIGNAIIKTLDFVCPSVIDLLSLCSFGGASVASRVAKLTKAGLKVGKKIVKLAGKAGSKTTAKTGSIIAKHAGQTVSKAALSQTKKAWAKVPTKLRKSILKNKNMLKKISRTSRQLKADIKEFMVLKQDINDIRAELTSMSSRDILVFLKNFIQLYLEKTSLPETRHIKKIIDSISDETLAAAVEYIRTKLKSNDYGISGEITLFDVFQKLLPKDIWFKLQQIRQETLNEVLSGSDSAKLRHDMKKSVVRFSYKKKSTGKVRHAKGTLKKSELPKFAEDRPAKPNVKNFVYWDTEKDQFRCFARDNFIGVDAGKGKKSEKEMTNMFDETVHNFSQQTNEGYGSVLRDYVAKRDKQNEWLTLYHDAEKLIAPFSDKLRGKKVYCNCDDPESSGTFQFLLDNFHTYGLKQLVSTGFYAKKKAIVTEQNISKGPAAYLVDNPGNGDMNSSDSMREARDADVIVSNPPFSKQDDSADMNLFCNWVKIAFESNCDLIGIGMTSSIKYVVGFNIKQKILNNELFVYPAHAYSFKRTGDKTRNFKDKEKDKVQISIYSTFNIDIEKFQPKPIKFNTNVYLNDLPLTKINNDVVHVTYNSNKFASFQQDVASGAFSIKMIPPPTPDNVGQMIVVPFSMIDYDYRKYFDLLDILNTVYVYDSADKLIARKMTGLCLKYNKTDGIEQSQQSEFKPEDHVIATDLTSDNIIQRVSAFKKWAHEQYLAGNIDLLLDYVHKKLNFMTHAPHGVKSDYTLKIEYAKQCRQFIYNLLDINARQPATDDSIFRKSTEIYKTSKNITDKNQKLSNLSRQLTIAKSIKNSDNVQLKTKVYPNLTIAGIERAQIQRNIIKKCVDFCEKFDDFLKKIEKASDIDIKNEAMRIKDFAHNNIVQHIDKLDKEIAAEIRYKMLRLDDIMAKAVSNIPYKTYNTHVNELNDILKSDIQYDNLDSVNRRLHDFNNLRLAIVMYKKYLENNKDQLDDELRNSILNKENELFSRLKQEISDFKKRTKHIRLGESTYISEAFSGPVSCFYHKKLTESDYIEYVAHMLDECFNVCESSLGKAYLSAVTKSGGIQIYDDAGKRLDREFDFTYDRDMHVSGLIGIPGWSVAYDNAVTALTDQNSDADGLTFRLLARFMADHGYELFDER